MSSTPSTSPDHDISASKVPSRLWTPAYTRYWTAASASALGDGLLVTGLPILATRVTNNEVNIGAIYAAGRVPWVFGLLIGSIVDRRDAKRVSLASDLLRGIVLIAFAIRWFVAPDTITVVELFLVALFVATCTVAFNVAVQRIVPAVVPTDQLERANGYLESSNMAGEQFVGPFIGAVLKSGWLFLGDGISFIASRLLLSGLGDFPPEDHSKSTLRDDMRVGWNWFKSSPPVWGLTIATSVVAALSTFVLSMEIIIIRKTLGLSQGYLGPLTAVIAIGGILGGIIAGRVVDILQEKTFTTCVVLSGFAYLACSNNRTVVVIFTLLAFQTMCVIVANVAAGSVRQRAIPAAYRSRVVGLCRSFIFGAQVPGAIIGGWIAARWNTDVMFLVAALGLFIVGFGTAVPLWRVLEPYQSKYQAPPTTQA